MNLCDEDVDPLKVLSGKLAVAARALGFYSGRDVYCWPDDWSCSKNGGGPDVDECVECSGVARDALLEIGEIIQ